MFPNQLTRPSLFNKGLGLAKGINWGSLLDNTQKTLGVINQAIPIVYQVKPIITNARTMFKIADEIRKPNSFNSNSLNNDTSSVVGSSNENKPIFYI